MGPDGVPTPSIPGDLTSGFVLAPVQNGTNSSDQYFARMALRWQPSDKFDLQLDYLHQHTAMADSQWGSAWSGGPFDSSYGALPHATVNTRPGCDHCTTDWVKEPFSDSIDLVDLVATLDVGLATISSATSYYNDNTVTVYDETGLWYGNPAANDPNSSAFLPYYPYLNYPRLTSPLRSEAGNRSFIEEVRLVSKPGTAIDYVVGLYYQRQPASVNSNQPLPGSVAYSNYIGMPNPTTHGDNIYSYNRNTVFTDKAVFGELTYHLTDNWQVTGGTRFFQQPYSSRIESYFYQCGAVCSSDQTNPLGAMTASSAVKFSNHIWKLNSSYDFTPTFKLYTTFSEGFRHGGVSGLPANGPYASPEDLQTFKPDLAKNYEVGVKGSLFDHRVSYFADVYLMNIQNFQFNSVNLSGGIPGAFNGSSARSQGLELESQIALTHQLTGSIGYAFTRSYVTETFNILDYVPFALVPSQGGTGQLAPLFGGPIPEGRELPGVSRHIVNASADYTIPANSMGTLTLHADANYRSSQASNINPGYYYYYVIPSAFLANARVSLETNTNLTYSLFVRNITNNPDFTGGVNDQEFNNPYRLRNVGRPRTVGLGFRYSFGGK